MSHQAWTALPTWTLPIGESDIGKTAVLLGLGVGGLREKIRGIPVSTMGGEYAPSRLF